MGICELKWGFPNFGVVVASEFYRFIAVGSGKRFMSKATSKAYY